VKTNQENRRKFSGINKSHTGDSELLEHDALLPRLLFSGINKSHTGDSELLEHDALLPRLLVNSD